MRYKSTQAEVCMSWWIWLVASAGLMVAEVLTLSLFLACFALGGVAAAIGAALGLSTASQLALFCAASVAGLVFHPSGVHVQESGLFHQYRRLRGA